MLGHAQQTPILLTLGETISASGQLLQVSAGAEHGAVVGDNAHAQGGVIVQVLEGGGELFHQLGAHGVAGLGTIQGDDEDAVALLGDQITVLSHRLPFSGLEC